MDYMKLPFMIIRPSGLPFVDEILSTLSQEGLSVEHRVVISDWVNAAHHLYFDKFGDEATSNLQVGARAWLESTAILFGRKALLYVVKQDRELNQNWVIETLLLLKKIKLGYRKSRATEKERITITCSFLGETYPVFFDYIHSPDPDPNRLTQEWLWLKNHGALGHFERCL